MKLCVITGEASGDLHAAAVIAELKQLDPSFSAFGIGGEKLAGQGVRILHDVRDLALVGLFNVLARLPMYFRVFRQTWSEILRQSPDAVLLVDFPGFNLRMARRCKEAGLKVIFFISPQVWAWRQSRIHQIAKYVDHTIVIFPFEQEFYQRHGVPVTYVGHPLVEQLQAVLPPDEDRVPVDPIRIALLPGSRKLEIALLLPPMVGAIKLLATERRLAPFILLAPTIERRQIESVLRKQGIDIPIVESDGKRALAQADLAIISSGTATLEAAILGVPAVVVYRLSRATYALGRRLMRLASFSLVNIVAGKPIVPELIQDQVNPAAIAEAARGMLLPENYRSIRAELLEVRRKLGDRGASQRAARKILTLVSGNRDAEAQGHEDAG
jgi:lipid-A-disaccharide synthase